LSLGVLFSHLRFAGELGSAIRVDLASRLARALIRERTTVSAYGFAYLGYPEASSSKQPVFQVHSKRTQLWRVNALDIYNHSRWYKSRASPRSAAERDAQGVYVIPEAPDFPPLPEGERPLNKHTITLLTYAQGALIAPARPVRVKLNVPRLAVDKMGLVSTSRVMDPGTTYVIECLETPPHLAAYVPRDAPLPDFVRNSAYMGLQDAPTTERVVQLAHQIVRDGEAETPFERARAIEQFVRENFVYDKKPGRIPWGVDVVDQFLFVTKRGFCIHFATAMAILCRQVGLASRYVVGYREGEEVEGEEDRYIVRGRDAHSWVEVFFPGVGWVEFDPTPAAEKRALERSWTERLRDWRGRMAAQWASGGPRGLGPLELPARLWLLLQAAAFAYLLHRFGWASISQRAARRLPPHDAVGRAYYQMLRYLQRRGLERRLSQAPYEFQRSAVGLWPEVAEPIKTLTEKFLLVTYGGRLPTDADARASWEALDRLREVLRRAPRVLPEV